MRAFNDKLFGAGTPTDAEIKTAYEANADTNAVTDAEKTVLGNTSGTNTGDADSSGTWNATLTGAGANPTTPVTATGIWSKSGDMYYVQVNFANKDCTGGSGAMVITGLPATVSGSAIATVGALSVDFGGGTYLWGLGSGTTIDIMSSADDGSWTAAQVTAATIYLYISMTFRIA